MRHSPFFPVLILLTCCGGNIEPPPTDDAGTTADAPSGDTGSTCVGPIDPDGDLYSWTCSDADPWVWLSATCPQCPPMPCTAQPCIVGSKCIVHNEWSGRCQ